MPMFLHNLVKVGHSSSLEAGGIEGMQSRWSFGQATGFNGLGNEPAKLQVSQELFNSKLSPRDQKRNKIQEEKKAPCSTMDTC